MAETNRVLSQRPPDAAEARRALGLVQSDPVAAQQALQDVVAGAVTADARALAHLGLGRVAYNRGAIGEASIEFTEAARHALDTGDVVLLSEIRVSWALAEQAAGRHDDALSLIALAVPHLEGAALGRALTQRGLVHATAGRREDALRDYDAGLPLLIEDDEPAAMRTFANRGVVLTHLGEYERATRDFTATREMAQAAGHPALVAGALHNLAYLHGRSGRFVAALAGFDDARQAYRAVGALERHLADLDIDEGEVLLELGLGVDAVPLADRVVRDARQSGNSAQLAEGLLMLARAWWLAGDSTAAVAAANEATELFEASGREAWAAQARYCAIVAAEGDAATSKHSALRRFIRLRREADQLERFGWLSEAAEVRVLTGRLALAAGRTDIASAVLHQASVARDHPLARVRAGAWHATALLHRADGDPRAASRALRAGLRAVEQHRATLGTSELRSATGRLVAPLAADGLAVALGSGRVASVLEWAERGRAGALGAPPATGGQTIPEDLRSDLRAARGRLNEAIASDEHVPDDLAEEVARLEADVSRRSRHRDGSGETSTDLRAADLKAALDGTTLVEFLELDGALHAVVCRERGLRLVRLGPTSTVVAANEHLAFAIRRLAVVPPGPASARSWEAFQTARGELQAGLFGPLRRHLGDGPLVVVPTGALHDILWGALPAAEAAHGLAVAPSAAWWLRAQWSAGGDRVLLVAGPALAHADAEVDALRTLHPTAHVLRGAEATVDAVLHGLSSARLVHIAAHGTFRSDNPMFSTLQLHDGPLFVHELEELAHVPETVVLAACSTGRAGVLPGDELLGTTAVLMGAGVRTVVAPLVPIADEMSVRVTCELHAAMRDGSSPAVALAAQLRAAATVRDGRAAAALASYTCVVGRTA